jgi:hypothetical protein
VLADSKGDVGQAAKILQGALEKAPAEDGSLDEARGFLDELDDGGETADAGPEPATR